MRGSCSFSATPVRRNLRASASPDPVEDFRVIANEPASFTAKPPSQEVLPANQPAHEIAAAKGHARGTRTVRGSRAVTAAKQTRALDPAQDNPQANKPTIIVATKIDAVNPAKLKKLAAYAKRRKLEFPRHLRRNRPRHRGAQMGFGQTRADQELTTASTS